MNALPPLPQQVITTQFIIDHPEAAVFVDCGLGKTRSVIDAVKHLMPNGETKGVLVIAPLRVALYSWPDELDLWGGLTYANLRTEEGMKAWRDGTKDVYLLNYEMLQQFAEKGLKGRKNLPVDMIVWDESSLTRNPSSKRVKAFLPYRSKFTRHVGLTGTPHPNSSLDLWGQFRLIDGGVRLGPSYHAFRNRFATSDYLGYTWELNEGSEEAIREKIADITLVMREEDWLKIPPVTMQDIEVTLPPEVMKGYKRLQKDMILAFERKEIVALSAAALVQKLAQYASGMSYYMDDMTRDVVYIHDLKLQALAKLHKDIGHRPLLVFTQFVHETERILKALPQAQAFDGERIGEWNAGKIPMWVVHPKSASHGLQLQGTCCDVVWFTLGYSYEAFKQGCSRVARTGQKNPTTIYRLLCTNTVDVIQASIIERKGDGESALKSALKHIKVLAGLPATG